MVNKWLQNVLGQILPGRCLLCSVPADAALPLCMACRQDLPAIPIACNHCALPLSVPGICAECLCSPPVWDAAIAPWSYSDVVPWFVHKFKFHHSLVHGRVLADGLVQRLLQQETRPDVIVPVPLHPRRLRQRGFNQALELARPVAQRLGVPIDPSLAQRILNTAEQSGLDAAQRGRNVRGAFNVSADLRGLSIAVVDDVMTTGNTMEAVVRALRRAGAHSVYVWVCARAEPPREPPPRKVISQ